MDNDHPPASSDIASNAKLINNTAETPENTTSSASSTRGSPKGAPPAKSVASGNRFQCPQCPKNFSRIENLTRHQANHDVVGKFACPICKKRFTRSDLLSRHRRIHDGPDKRAGSSRSHVINNSVSPVASEPQPISNLVHHDEKSSIEFVSTLPPSMRCQAVPHDSLPPIQEALYSDSRSPSTQSQGLSSLVEAALAPLPPDNSFHAPENFNPNAWDGFMLYNDNPSIYMGSYDADISWTLDCFSQDPLSNIDFDFGFGFVKSDAPGQSSDLDAEGDEEDWPDKVSRLESPPKWGPRVIPKLGPESWYAVAQEAMSCGFTIGPRQKVNDVLRSTLLGMLQIELPAQSGDTVYVQINISTFPPSEVLDYFLRLYFKHVHPRFPITHIPTFDIFASSPLLVSSMMFLGSCYSRADRGLFLRLFHNRGRVASMRLHEIEEKHLRILDNIFSLFNLLVAGAWGGSKKMFEFAEGVRGILITASRRARLLDCRPISRVQLDPSSLPRSSPQEIEWFSWIETEKRKRLGLSIYILDCQYASLFNVQPYISRAETTNCAFPCPEQHWEAPSPQAWKILLGPAEIPPATYYLQALNGILLHKWTKPPPPFISTTVFGKNLVLYGIHTLIFDWRSSVSMLNPTGLMGTAGNHALDIGAGLLSKRKWLIDALDSWNECYGGSSGEHSIAGRLLCALGYVSLDVSLSDVHLMAGRSSSRQDCEFAAVNLRYWANSDIVSGTMKHVYGMLNLSYECIRIRDENGVDGVLGTMGLGGRRSEEASYEIALCLFTGGLVCWVYKELRTGLGPQEKEEVMEGIRRAGRGLRGMRCWKMAEMFGRILATFER
ncbi:9c00934b-a060-4ffd-be6f-0b6ba9a40e9b [Sclerotinia trifoliorum]|uniref:9c00934b-a060-4ffd-be6f-0b6ba9a40e9b n=1 Tax=Sclerotinia trifoliorum TaxID=28548 RepID=A0A8H2ZLL4_9HELO|nr:9c00934b-a060-4ffd-be6f-0b6ba9a40e9b [Sclerotinia trifoliorum]